MMSCAGLERTGTTPGRVLLFCAVLLLEPIGLAGRIQSPERGDGSPIAGLWSYETLAPAKGSPVRLSGLFLFSNGYFIQEALNDGEPFDRQAVQAHAGTYSVDAANRVQLVTEVQLAIRPGRVPAVVSNPGRTHEIAPAREGDRLTLTFGSGTVQTFRRSGPGEGRIVLLETGALALVDGKFILVAETGGSQVVGAGRVEAAGPRLALVADRWATAANGKVAYQRQVRIDAELDDAALRVPGMPPLRVRSGGP